MSRPALITDERGTTLNELLVGIAIGMVVFLALSALIMATLRTTTRVSARVDATQQARVAMNKVLIQLQSACILPKVPPIQQDSSDTVLRFTHAPGSEVAPQPVWSEITYQGEALTQTDYATTGTPPGWGKGSALGPSVTLIDGIRPLSASRPVFRYFGSSNGSVSTTPLATPLTGLDPGRTINVAVAFMADPSVGSSSEDATAARIQGSVSLRLTAASYNPTAVSLPCE